MLIKNSCIIVMVFSFLVAKGMDNNHVFARTGKEKYTPTWRVPPNKVGYKEMHAPGWFNLFRSACTARDNDFTDSKKPDFTVKKVVEALGQDINTPLYQFKDGRDLKYYMYPIEALIWDSTKNTVLLEALLANGVPVNGYPDYSPLKDILLILASGTGNALPGMLLQFLKILIAHGVSLDTKLPDHTGIEKKDASLCCNCTAREFLTNTKVVWKDTAIKKQVEALFTASLASQSESKVAVTQQSPSGSLASPSIHCQAQPAIQSPKSTSEALSNVIPEVSTPSLQSASPNVPTQNSSLPNAAQSPSTTMPSVTSHAASPQSVMDQRALQWLKAQVSNGTATVTAVIGLAALIAAARIVWNWYHVETTESPARIVISNQSDTAIALGYMELQSDVMADIVLKPGASWELDMNTMQLRLIITSHTSLENPLAINLEQYRLPASQEKRSLHITIHNNSRIQYWSTRIPYGYAVTWQ